MKWPSEIMAGLNCIRLPYYCKAFSAEESGLYSVSFFYFCYYESILTTQTWTFPSLLVWCFPLCPYFPFSPWLFLLYPPVACWPFRVHFTLLFHSYCSPWPCHPPLKQIWDPGSCSHGGKEIKSRMWWQPTDCCPDWADWLCILSVQTTNSQSNRPRLDWLQGRWCSCFKLPVSWRCVQEL